MMIHISDYDFNKLPDSFKRIKTNKKITYLNIESSFDIETTSTYVENKKQAFMYIWMFGIGHDVIYGRTWEELKILESKLSEFYGLGVDKRLIIYIHNLAYEFQFMRKYFDWKTVFASAERKPLKAVTQSGIEFRCSYMLSGYSLDKLAENLVNHDIKKLKGNLDYDKIRTPDTHLTKLEMDYCNNDVEIVNSYIREQMEQYVDITKIPLTNTGRVRTYVRNQCYYTSKSHKKSNKGKYIRYRKIMEDLTLSEYDYFQLKRAFMGGFTHANGRYSGQVLKDVSSIDFTSSYPSVILSEKFPMSRAKQIKINKISELDDLCSNYGVIFNVTFYNIQSSIPQENYISESKCLELEKPIINNGRVHKADKLTTTITNVDYEIIKRAYNYDDIGVSEVKYYHLGYLPKAIIESVLKLYQDKTELKGVEGKEVEYMLSKGMLNSIYGMTVTDIVRDDHIYSEEGWDKEDADITEQIDKYNKSKNRFLYYPWGVWITAYARRNLWTGIFSMGHDYVYSDTDSIKLLNLEDNQKYIDDYNTVIYEKMKRVLNEYKLDLNLLSPKNKQGEKQTIGIWDFEGTYKRFKTLGSKRYLVQENDGLYLTVAGLSKQNGLDYMIDKCNNNFEEVFKMFNNELYVPPERTGKMTHTYIDDEHNFKVTDYTGIETEIRVLSSVHLERADYTLSVGKQYREFLYQLKNGYLHLGVDTI